jgi:hypothetical protein
LTVVKTVAAWLYSTVGREDASGERGEKLEVGELLVVGWDDGELEEVRCRREEEERRSGHFKYREGSKGNGKCRCRTAPASAMACL